MYSALAHLHIWLQWQFPACVCSWEEVMHVMYAAPGSLLFWETQVVAEARSSRSRTTRGEHFILHWSTNCVLETKKFSKCSDQGRRQKQEIAAKRNKTPSVCTQKLAPKDSGAPMKKSCPDPASEIHSSVRDAFIR